MTFSAKAKDNGSRLRSNLRNYNIDLPQGRRKTCRTTGFTALCEGEANQLAKDFNELLLDKGGADEIGKVYAAQQLSESNPEDAIKEAEAVEKIANFLMGSHKADQLPDDMECNNSMEKSIMTLSLVCLLTSIGTPLFSSLTASATWRSMVWPNS